MPPFTIVKKGSKYCVVSSGRTYGCHPTKARARAQQRALYANDASVEDVNALIREATDAAFAYEQSIAATYARAFKRSAKEAASRFRAETASAWTPPLTNTIVSPMTEEEMQEARRKRDQAAAAFLAILAPLGIAAFTVPFIEALNTMAANAFTDLLYDRLRRTILDSLSEGLSAEETARAITQAFENMAPVTAQMLAETELTAITNEGALRAAKKKKIRYKTWGTVGDNRVRLAHATASGQTVPIDQPYSVGGYPLMYPGDPFGPPALVLRCRCHQTFTDSLSASAVAPIVMEDQMTAIEELGNVTVTVEDEPAVEGAQSLSWHGIITLENVSTGDGRFFAADAWSWRSLPLTLMAQTVNQEGHKGAQVSGRIERIYKLSIEDAAAAGYDVSEIPEDAVLVMGEGEFDTGEFGREIARMVKEETLRGISVDYAVTKAALRDPLTGEILSPDEAEIELADMLFGSKYERAALEAEIGAATVVPFPAFANASIAMTASGLPLQLKIADESVVLTAAAAGFAPLRPPREWLENPGLTGPTPMTVTEDGRVYGHAALFDSCHIAEPRGPGICVPPPRSGMNYSVFHHGVVVADNGDEVPCGQITLGTSHAPLELTWRETIRHYEDSGLAVADVRAGEDEWGIWVSGGLRPNISAAKVREMKAGALSGDWRQVIGRGLEFLAALVVNVPGFLIPRPEARVVASAAGEELVLSLVAAGIAEPENVMLTKPEYLRKVRTLLREVDEHEDWIDGLRTFSSKERRRLAKTGAAMPDGSFPIVSCADWDNARRAVGRAPASKRAAVKAHIARRGRSLGCGGGND